MIHDPQRSHGPRPGQASGVASDGERVAKALARAGVASRREVERLIESGRVALNGVVLTTPAIKVGPADILTVDGKVVSDAEPARLFRYHKPVGLVTTHKDPQGRPTVFASLPAGLPRLISVGRLDLNSEGLLLLTNDGGLSRALELPSTGLMRRYRARARGRITQDRLDALKDGITVEGVHYGAIEATLDKAKEGPTGANLWITITLAEGKNREVRRVLEAVGLKVNRLMRLAYGPFALGTLLPGEIEEVGPRVIREQLADHIDPANMPKGDRPQFTKAASAGPSREAGEAVRRGREQRRPEGASRGAPKVEPPAKPVYKAGWAKPKPAKNAPPAGSRKPTRKAAPTVRDTINPPRSERSSRPSGPSSRPAGASRPSKPGGPKRRS